MANASAQSILPLSSFTMEYGSEGPEYMFPNMGTQEHGPKDTHISTLGANTHHLGPSGSDLASFKNTHRSHGTAVEDIFTYNTWNNGNASMWTDDTVTVTENISQLGNVTSLFKSAVSLNYPLPSMIAIAVVLFVVTIGTAFGNFLVGLSLFKFRNLRTVSNYLIGNLALSDFLLATTILPLSTVNECLGYWVFGQIICNFWLCADVLYCTASIWNLCIIAFDRFTATLYPVWYREKRSPRQAAMYISIVWVFSVAICIPPLLGWNDLSQTYMYDNTTNTYQCIPFSTPSYVLYSASGSFFIPFIITVFLYIRIFSVLRKRMLRMRANRGHDRNKNAKKAPIKKPMLNNLAKPEQEIEMSQVPPTQDGSGNTEELSSKSLFGSGTDSGADKSDEDDEDSSAQMKSDHPLYVSSSDAESTRIVKNGLREKGTGSEMLVILNPAHTFSESEKESDRELIQVVVTTEDESLARDSDAEVRKNLKNKANKSKLKIGKDNLQVQDDDAKAGMGRKAFVSALQKVNPFKQQREKLRTSQQKKRYDQREVRATIRMAIIIACFCGCWLGFFTIYTINGWCGKQCSVPRELDAFFFWLGYANSSMNPILYAIFNEEFRRAFQKLLGCYQRGKHGSSAASRTRPH